MDKVKELETKVIKAAQAYYTGNSIMSDSEFDSLIEELRKESNNQSPLLTTPGWGYSPVDSVKCNHSYQTVGSLSKYRDMNSLKRDYDTSRATVSTKLDGISCVAYFIKGKLSKAITRGNGKEGVVITDKYLSTIGGISQASDYPFEDFTGAVRGELVMTNENWIKFKEIYPEYKNSRNAVAGVINAKYSTYKEMKEKCQHISFIAYKVMGVEDDELLPTELTDIPYEKILEGLSGLGFNVVPYTTNLDEYKEFFEKNISTLPCDGIVVNMKSTYNPFTHAVEYVDVAYKFEDEKAESRVKYIEWSQTRTGKYMPVAVIEPVELDGAEIERVTCFNAQYVIDNKIGTGALIEIQRSGQVIPDIQRVLEESDNVEIPRLCESCNEKLVMDGVDLVCGNPHCSGKVYSRLYNYIDQMAKVKGISSKGIVKFIEILGYKDIYDIYNKTIDECVYIISHSDLGEATMNKYLEMLDWLYVNEIDPRYFFTGLNIEGLGWKTAEAISKSHPLFEMITAGLKSDENPLYDTSEIIEELKKLPGFGSATINSIMDNIGLIDTMSTFVNYRFKSLDEPESKSERKFCVTGKLNTGSRSELESYAKSKGWILVDINNAEYLVTNDPDPTSSKGKKAKSKGIPIISESEFLEMLENE